jgi:hypothetical protein
MTNDQAEQIIALLNQIAALLTEMQSAMNANANRLEAAIHHASGQIINRG